MTERGWLWQPAPSPHARPGDSTVPIIWAMVFSYSATIFLEEHVKKSR